MIHLVRDPRAVIQSRKFIEWCTDEDCASSAFLCDMMVKNYKEAVRLSREFPNTFK